MGRRRPHACLNSRRLRAATVLLAPNAEGPCIWAGHPAQPPQITLPSSTWRQPTKRKTPACLK
eukprot:6146169-Lingulodinium_polyedra.AAC.1